MVIGLIVKINYLTHKSPVAISTSQQGLLYEYGLIISHNSADYSGINRYMEYSIIQPVQWCL